MQPIKVYACYRIYRKHAAYMLSIPQLKSAPFCLGIRHDKNNNDYLLYYALRFLIKRHLNQRQIILVINNQSAINLLKRLPLLQKNHWKLSRLTSHEFYQHQRSHEDLKRFYHFVPREFAQNGRLDGCKYIYRMLRCLHQNLHLQHGSSQEDVFRRLRAVALREHLQPDFSPNASLIDDLHNPDRSVIELVVGRPFKNRFEHACKLRNAKPKYALLDLVFGYISRTEKLHQKHLKNKKNPTK